MHVSFFQQPFCAAPSHTKLCLSLPHLSALICFLFNVPTQSSASALSLCPSRCSCEPRSFFVNCSGLNLSSFLVFPPLDTQFLDLSGCSLNSSPSLNKLWRLQTLLLAQNKIKEVGDLSWMGIQSLQILDLSRNRISVLSMSFSKDLDLLIHLILSYNLLHTLSELCLQHLHNLEYLDLQGNLITSLQPGVLRPLTKLRHLQLQNNLLKSLQSDEFSVLQRLELLDLSGNQIQELPPMLFNPLHSLTFLNLQQNQLHHLRFQTLCNLPARGTIMLLSQNPWECDCDLQRVFGKLAGVHRLSLQDSKELRCAEPPQLRERPLTSLDTGLCVAETVTVLVITLTVTVTVVGAIVAAERSRKKSPRTQEYEISIQD
ncbi:hypothetical protein XENTR_v10024500 [Xenopus tropicalis]|uniref:LRRCT domain-containing protein n=1 Tax=Xenopus tropicalis TaxID=8364 RepID=A0A6I8R0P7_XENTR|nr:hypothetical protein XENTR_v10024500 [Xenopus tropicalis]